MQLEAREIRHPEERGRIARHDFLGESAGRKFQRDHVDPVGTRPRRALLIEEFAAHPVGISDEYSSVFRRQREVRRQIRQGNSVQGPALCNPTVETEPCADWRWTRHGRRPSEPLARYSSAHTNSNAGVEDDDPEFELGPERILLTGDKEIRREIHGVLHLSVGVVSSLSAVLRASVLKRLLISCSPVQEFIGAAAHFKPRGLIDQVIPLGNAGRSIRRRSYSEQSRPCGPPISPADARARRRAGSVRRSVHRYRGDLTARVLRRVRAPWRPQSPVERHHGIAGHPFQHSVQGQNLRPVGVVRGRCFVMNRCDRRLELVRTNRSPGQRTTDERDPFRDSIAIPSCRSCRSSGIN